MMKELVAALSHTRSYKYRVEAISQEWLLKCSLLNGILSKEEGRADLCLLPAVLHATPFPLSMAVQISMHTFIKQILLRQKLKFE